MYLLFRFKFKKCCNPCILNYYISIWLSWNGIIGKAVIDSFRERDLAIVSSRLSSVGGGHLVKYHRQTHQRCREMEVKFAFLYLSLAIRCILLSTHPFLFFSFSILQFFFFHSVSILEKNTKYRKHINNWKKLNRLHNVKKCSPYFLVVLIK